VDTKNLTLSLDDTNFSTFTECQRKFHYYHNLRRESNRHNEATSFGSIWHVAMKQHYSRLPTAVITKTIEDGFAKIPLPESHRTLDLLLRGFAQYTKDFPRPKEPFHVTVRPWTVEDGPVEKALRNKNGDPVYPRLEMPFELPFCDLEVGGKTYTIKWKGRIDGIVQSKDTGMLSVMDHKTTSILGQSLFNTFLLSNQFQGYMWAASVLMGQPVHSTFANVAAFRKPSKTGKEIEFHREMIFTNDNQLAEWKENTTLVLRDLLEKQVKALKENDFHATEKPFTQNYRNCVGKYGTCAYHKVCTTPKEYRQVILYSEDYKEVTWDCLNIDEV